MGAMVTSESLPENAYCQGITNCYTLYFEALILRAKAAYTADHNAKISMKRIWKILSISLLLSSGMTCALAQIDSRGRDDQMRTEAWAGEPGGRFQSSAEPRRDSQSLSFPAGQQNLQPVGAKAIRSGSESRKSTRLTPEERRALRRQINEAGRDIYTSPQ